MIDTHAHILPGLDDGAVTADDTRRLFEAAAAEQLHGIIATPHLFHPNFKVTAEATKQAFETAKELGEKEGYPTKLYTGHECRLSESLVDELNAGQAFTLADSRYVLLELPSSGIPAYTVPIIQNLILNNYVPVIAHAERNQAIIDKPERLRKLITHGAMAQVTAGSITGHFGKAIQRVAMQLIEAQMIHVYGSDVHDSSKRPFLFNKGLDFLEKRDRHDYVDLLLENNERITEDRPLIVLEPQEIPRPKWWNIFA